MLMLGQDTWLDYEEESLEERKVVDDDAAMEDEHRCYQSEACVTNTGADNVVASSVLQVVPTTRKNRVLDGVVALNLLGHELAHRKVLFEIDYIALVFIVNKQSTRNAHVVKLLGVFMLGCVRHDVVFKTGHGPGVNNDTADAL
ncbi:hypothetical protein NDU88_000301 [Pleurodeles waltl]|uniref:RNase H type-1 domain-containing protein n=1 Tax=Pleurodeles waltl TaxID=8319 RepID=A0AAV7TF23_PLEWA|nr:hypothetical protein NDU88_000301 [Pleurodeles waltl]